MDPCDCDQIEITELTVYPCDETGKPVGDQRTYQRLPDGTLLLSGVEEMDGAVRKVAEEN